MPIVEINCLLLFCNDGSSGNILDIEVVIPFDVTWVDCVPKAKSPGKVKLATPTKIPPEWHSWIHFIKNEIPNKNAKKFLWQKKYVENLTGTNMAHKPEGSLKFKSKKNMKKYEVWKD